MNKGNKRKLKLILLAAIVLIIGFAIPLFLPTGGRTDWFVCGTNLHRLHHALLVYAKDHNDAIPASNWCNELLKTGIIEKNNLICPESHAQKGQCTYALNKNVIGRKYSDLNPDTIVFFETAPSYNQIGGREILLMRHGTGKTAGANFAYAQKGIYFEMGDPNRLCWRP